MKKTVCVIYLLIIGFSAFAQEDNQLERRWLILLSKEDQHPQLQKQLGLIEAHKQGAIERKIAVMQVTNLGAKAIFNSTANTTGIAETFNNTRSKDTDFEAILIGIDGTVKLRRKRAIAIDELFDLVDSMPMRKEELQRQVREERLKKERKEILREHK